MDSQKFLKGILKFGSATGALPFNYKLSNEGWNMSVIEKKKKLFLCWLLRLTVWLHLAFIIAQFQLNMRVYMEKGLIVDLYLHIIWIGGVFMDAGFYAHVCLCETEIAIAMSQITFLNKQFRGKKLLIFNCKN